MAASWILKRRNFRQISGSQVNASEGPYVLQHRISGTWELKPPPDHGTIPPWPLSPTSCHGLLQKTPSQPSETARKRERERERREEREREERERERERERGEIERRDEGEKEGKERARREQGEMKQRERTERERERERKDRERERERTERERERDRQRERERGQIERERGRAWVLLREQIYTGSLRFTENIQINMTTKPSTLANLVLCNQLDRKQSLYDSRLSRLARLLHDQALNIKLWQPVDNTARACTVRVQQEVQTLIMTGPPLILGCFTRSFGANLHVWFEWIPPRESLSARV